MKKRRIFDETFKQMAVELSHVKGAEQEVARQLGIDSGRITKWRQSHKSSGQPPTAGLSEEQKQSKRLEKELKEAQLERAILWRGSASSPGERGNIRVYCRKRQPISPLERWVRCSRWVVVGTITGASIHGRKHRVGARQLKASKLLDNIWPLHTQSRGWYGSPRIADELRERGVKASRNGVARLMHKEAYTHPLGA